MVNGLNRRLGGTILYNFVVVEHCGRSYVDAYFTHATYRIRYVNDVIETNPYGGQGALVYILCYGDGEVSVLIVHRYKYFAYNTTGGGNIGTLFGLPIGGLTRDVVIGTIFICENSGNDYRAFGCNKFRFWGASFGVVWWGGDQLLSCQGVEGVPGGSKGSCFSDAPRVQRWSECCSRLPEDYLPATAFNSYPFRDCVFLRGLALAIACSASHLCLVMGYGVRENLYRMGTGGAMGGLWGFVGGYEFCGSSILGWFMAFLYCGFFRC